MRIGGEASEWPEPIRRASFGPPFVPVDNGARVACGSRGGQWSSRGGRLFKLGHDVVASSARGATTFAAARASKLGRCGRTRASSERLRPWRPPLLSNDRSAHNNNTARGKLADVRHRSRSPRSPTGES